LIPSGTIVEGKIVVGWINCPNIYEGEEVYEEQKEEELQGVEIKSMGKGSTDKMEYWKKNHKRKNQSFGGRNKKNKHVYFIKIGRTLDK